MSPTPPFDRRAHPAGLSFARWAAPDGWVHRRYDWPAADPRGDLIFLSGRGDFAEKYLEAMAHWRDRGWSVSGFDWRGQGGSGRIVPGSDAGHLASLAPLVDDLAGFATGLTRRPRVMVGHSMGGHVLLRAAAEGRVEADALVLVAPMLGLPGARVGRLAAFLAGLFGQTLRPLVGELDPATRQKRLTASTERFDDARWWRETQPGLGLGAPTWGWVHAAYDSMAALARPGVLERVRAPVLVIASRRDRVVAAGAIERAARRLPDARLVWLDGAHELLREAEPVRSEAHAAIDAFLKARLG